MNEPSQDLHTERERESYLCDAMPVNDNSFGVKFIGEFDMEGVSGAGTDCGPRELAVDGHHNPLYAVRRPVHVLHFPFVEVPVLGQTQG